MATPSNALSEASTQSALVGHEEKSREPKARE
jgi:hypothetical protein